MTSTQILALTILTCATTTAGAQRRVAWSPDATRLAFTFDDKDSSGIWVVAVDGSGLRRLYASGKHDAYPSWSSDGRQVLFASDSGGHMDIYAIGTEGGPIRRLTHEGQNTYPSWSPDGGSVAFSSNRAGKWQLFVMRSDGSDVRQITHTTSAEWNPEWSPDGKWLAFESTRNGHDQDDIYIVKVATGEERQLTQSLDNEIFPAWSRDGERIAYCVVIPRVRGDLWVVDVATKSSKLLLQDGCLPQWSPRGTEIAFARGKGDAPGIYVVDVGTLTARRVVR